MIFFAILSVISCSRLVEFNSSFFKDITNLKILAKGRTKHVHGYHSLLGKHVMVKSSGTSKKLWKMMVDEIKALVILSTNQYYPQAYGYFTNDESLFLVMEYVPSFDLRQILSWQFHARLYPYAPFYIAQIMTALEIIHGYGLLYIDMKDENILIDQDGLVKLADFGGCATPEEVRNKGYETFCSPLYAAPEILDPDIRGRTRGFASDWWSFGIVCHMIFLGRRPFQALTMDSLIDEIVYKPIVLSHELQPFEEQFLSSLLKRNICERKGFHNQLDDLKRSPLFTGINWDDMKSRNLHAPLKFDINLFN